MMMGTNDFASLESEWWQAALTAPDQLRQRVAFALAEIFVISSCPSLPPPTVVAYQNMLVNDAFTNFSTIMKDVTLSPGMGLYLNMLNSYKPGNGEIANENYARELLQLFTVGLVLLNPDGTPRLDSSGNMIPAYTQNNVQAFARAFTGWSFATSTGGSPNPANLPNAPPVGSLTLPMAPVDAVHDTRTKKRLLNDTVLPGQWAKQDLSGALQNIFNHPNVGPFVCRQLIQHLVTGDPSPKYVARVAAVFADNGSHVRGDMKAVISAILIDPEARAGDTDATAQGGHLREPVLWLSAVMRGLGFVNNDAAAGNDVVANASYKALGNYTAQLGETPYASSSVFNFFPPDYVIPGTTINAPEFGLEYAGTVAEQLSLADTVVHNGISGFNVDLSATSTLGQLAAKPADLVDRLGMIFMHDQMSSEMRTTMINHISTLTDMGQRVRVAVYLVVTSSQYKIEH